jgi:hypothetical protein
VVLDHVDLVVWIDGHLARLLPRLLPVRLPIRHLAVVLSSVHFGIAVSDAREECGGTTDLLEPGGLEERRLMREKRIGRDIFHNR